jgi:hypothetical protein
MEPQCKERALTSPGSSRSTSIGFFFVPCLFFLEPWYILRLAEAEAGLLFLVAEEVEPWYILRLAEAEAGLLFLVAEEVALERVYFLRTPAGIRSFFFSGRVGRVRRLGAPPSGSNEGCVLLSTLGAWDMPLEAPGPTSPIKTSPSPSSACVLIRARFMLRCNCPTSPFGLR